MFLGTSWHNLESQGVPLYQVFRRRPPYVTQQFWWSSDVSFQNKSQIMVQKPSFWGILGQKLESQGVRLCQAFSRQSPYVTEQFWWNSDVSFQKKGQIRVHQPCFWRILGTDLKVRESHCVRPLVDDPLMLLNNVGEILMCHFRIKAK